MKRKLYLHIGIWKTGTTALQDFFLANREGLLREGIDYPKIGLLNSSHNRLGASFYDKEKRPPAIQNLDTNCLHEYIDEICNISSDVLLSTELIWHQGRNAYKLKKLKEEFQVKIIIYLRRQDDYIVSAYNQAIKSGQYQSFDEFSARVLKQNNIDYYNSVLAKWSDIFGQENIIVRPYEKQQFYGGTIFSDFLSSVLRISMDKNFEILPQKSNQSFSLDALEFKRLINQLPTFDYSQKQAFKDILVDYSKCSERSLVSPQYSLISPNMKFEIIQKYADSNSKIAREYLGRKNGVLFLNPIPNPEEEWASYPGLAAENIEQILVFIKKRKPKLIKTLLEEIRNNLSSKDCQGKHAVYALSAIL